MNVRGVMKAVAASLVLVGCSDDGTGLEAVDLQGMWNATIYEFTDNANSQNVVDIIQRDGASFTLTVDATGSASTLLDDGLGGSSSDSGILTSAGTTLTLGGVAFDAVRSGNVLTLTNANRQFDFGSGVLGEQPRGCARGRRRSTVSSRTVCYAEDRA